jgi:hypothetical protein
MTLLLAFLVLAPAQKPLTFEYTIGGGLTEEANGRIYIAAGLLEHLGYHVLSADGKTVRAKGYGHTVTLPVRPVRISTGSENTSDLVPLDRLDSSVRQTMRIVRRSDIPHPASQYVSDSHMKQAVAVFSRSIVFVPRAVATRRWFAVEKKTIPDVATPVRMLGITIGRDEWMRDLSLARKPLPVPSSFLSAEVIFQFDRSRLPRDYASQHLPYEAFAMRLNDGTVLAPRGLIDMPFFSRTADGRVSMIPTKISVGPNPDVTLATVTSFWIPPDRTPVEMVYCDGRALLRTKLTEFKGPVSSLDPIAFGQDFLYGGGQKFPYTEVFR